MLYVDIPSLADFVPGYEASMWYGIGAPRNTPVAIINALNKEINAALADPQINSRLAALGGSGQFPWCGDVRRQRHIERIAVDGHGIEVLGDTRELLMKLGLLIADLGPDRAREKPIALHQPAADGVFEILYFIAVA